MKFEARSRNNTNTAVLTIYDVETRPLLCKKTRRVRPGSYAFGKKKKIIKNYAYVKLRRNTINKLNPTSAILTRPRTLLCFSLAFSPVITDYREHHTNAMICTRYTYDKSFLWSFEKKGEEHAYLTSLYLLFTPETYSTGVVGFSSKKILTSKRAKL